MNPKELMCKNAARILFALLLALIVTACGQKGPLYLPDAQVPAVAAEAPAPDARDEEGPDAEPEAGDDEDEDGNL